MEESIRAVEARKGADVTVPVRPAKLLKALDAWREAQPEKPSRPEAIRRLLMAALDPKA